MRVLSVLMPVYNESRTLRTIVSRVLAAPVDLEIELVCVDDGSTDGSLAILKDLEAGDPRIRVISQPRNMGKGKAIRTAIDHMTGDIALIQDADLEYDPADYPRLIGPILNGDADAVYGSRFAASEVRRVLFYWHSVGNKLLTTLSNMVNDLNLTDMETGFKAVEGSLIRRLRLTSDRFGIEPEMTARLAQTSARIYEVPISYHGRTYSEGKNIGWKDGLEALWLILKFKLLDDKPTRDAGHLTLESLGTVPAISRWMLGNFKPFLGEDVFEAGCGSGNLTEHLLDRKSLRAVDIDQAHVESIRSRFGHLENLRVTTGDLESADTYHLDTTVDSVICVNVLEHLDKPEAALEGFHSVIRPGGHALLLVPAHQWLFSPADAALEHRKRYTIDEVTLMVEAAGFEIVRCEEFNRLGVLGWLINKALGRTTISKIQARLFGFLLPLARMVERVAFLPGLSVVAIARKP